MGTKKKEQEGCPWGCLANHTTCTLELLKEPTCRSVGEGGHRVFSEEYQGRVRLSRAQLQICLHLTFVSRTSAVCASV